MKLKEAFMYTFYIALTERGFVKKGDRIEITDQGLINYNLNRHIAIDNLNDYFDIIVTPDIWTK